MDVLAFLERLTDQPHYDGQIRHVETLPPRPARCATPDVPLREEIAAMVAARGIETLYTHQVATLDAARAGHDVVVVTGTASGKTLAYHLPILEALSADPDARALYLYPTKALAQDQLKGLLDIVAGTPDGSSRFVPGVFDGDTPTAERRRIKSEANLVLSNPDMVHVSILPYHTKWARFFEGLRFVVLDEVHNYRGILGANVACVLRRLQRVCRHYGSSPQFLAASATIANPGELASRLVGRDVHVIDDDGSPRGRKFFVLWNPAAAGAGLTRASASDDATLLMSEAIEADAQVLTFTRTRVAAELIQRYARERLQRQALPHAEHVRAYRGGYLAKERRAIEEDLFAGRLRGVAATNALELGVDVGSLDVALLVGYPGTVASTWQQAGRSGRRADDSLAVLLAGNDPIDQYLLRHPRYFFEQTPEHAVVDPQNPYVVANHLKAAAFELPLSEHDADAFGRAAPLLIEQMESSGDLTRIGDTWYFAAGQNPATRVSLRHMSDNTFAIVLRTGEAASQAAKQPSRQVLREPDKLHQVIANVDAISAPELVYPQAVYLHRGEPYFVRELDLEGKVAYVERHEMDYYTQAILDSHVKILASQERDENRDAGQELAFGDVEVSWQTVAFKKIRFNTRENLGLGPVDLPAQQLLTTALWLAPSKDVAVHMKVQGLRVSEGLVGLRNLAIVALPIVAMCDTRDVSGVVDTQNLGRSTMILYDRYPGGLGYCEQGFRRFRELLAVCAEMVDDCPCDDGCPSCVGLPNQRPAIHSDPDLSRGYPIPNKQATIFLLGLLRHRDEATAPAAATASMP